MMRSRYASHSLEAIFGAVEPSTVLLDDEGNDEEDDDSDVDSKKKKRSGKEAAKQKKLSSIVDLARDTCERVLQSGAFCFF